MGELQPSHGHWGYFSAGQSARNPAHTAFHIRGSAGDVTGHPRTPKVLSGTVLPKDLTRQPGKDLLRPVDHLLPEGCRL